MFTKQYYVYIVTNKIDTVLYVGITNDLIRRIDQYKQGIGPAFTSKYHINKLVYYEITNDINEAINREKQIKAGSRKKKIELIESINPTWKDLYDYILL